MKTITIEIRDKGNNTTEISIKPCSETTPADYTQVASTLNIQAKELAKRHGGSVGPELIYVPVRDIMDTVHFSDTDRTILLKIAKKLGIAR